MPRLFSGDFLLWVNTFLSVLETRSIQRSSKLLFLSPSAVSYHIRKLEEELGRKLFERDKNGMIPTQEGLRFKSDVLPILNMLKTLREGESSTPLVEGVVNIACMDRLAHELALSIIEFRRVFPKVKFNLNATTSTTVRELVQSGMVDFGLAINREMPSFMMFTPLRPSSAFLYTPPGNPWDLSPMLTWNEICELPFIALTLEGYINPLLYSMPDMKQPKNILLSVNNFLLAMQLVRHGIGACIAPPLTPLEDEGDYTIFNIDHIFPIGRLGIITRRDKVLSRQAEAFMEYLKETYPGHCPEGQ